LKILKNSFTFGDFLQGTVKTPKDFPGHFLFPGRTKSNMKLTAIREKGMGFFSQSINKCIENKLVGCC
jgi:hypothetical protein